MAYLCPTPLMEKQLNEIDGEMKTTGWVGRGSGGSREEGGGAVVLEGGFFWI